MPGKKKKRSKVCFVSCAMCDSLPLHLPTMTFSNIEIKRENSVKFLGVIIDENLTWKNQKIKFLNILKIITGLVIYLTSKTFWKSISPSLTFRSVMLILHGLVLLILHGLVLQGIVGTQRHATQTTFHKNRFNHSRPLLKEDKRFKCFSNHLQFNSNS